MLARVRVYQREMVNIQASSCWEEKAVSKRHCGKTSGAENHLVTIVELQMLKNSTET